MPQSRWTCSSVSCRPGISRYSARTRSRISSVVRMVILCVERAAKPTDPFARARTQVISANAPPAEQRRFARGAAPPMAQVASIIAPAARVSSVRFDVLVNEELAAASCASLARCTRTRVEMLDGLGRGIGATGAHELGHQAGLGFARDAPCDDCYDSKSSATSAHFFGRKHWSDAALARMRGTLR